MKLKRIIDISLKTNEKATVPKNEQWIVSLFSIDLGFEGLNGSLNGDEPRLYAGDFIFKGIGSGKIVGFCFSDDSNKYEIKLKKHSDVSIKLNENENWTVPYGKILVATTRELGFIPKQLGKYYINGGTRLNANTSGFLTGVLFDVVKE